MLRSLSGRLLLLTILTVMLTEVAIFGPSVARFREDYLALRLERAQIASLALLDDGMISPELESELLRNAGVYNVVLRRDSMRQLALSSPVPAAVSQTFDLRHVGAWPLIRDALMRLARPEDEVIRVIGMPVRDGGEEIEVTMQSAPLRAAMVEYGTRILWLSAVISAVVAAALFLAVRILMVRPISKVVAAMQDYSAAPEDARRVITPGSNVRELREAEEALRAMQTDLSGALKQKERLAQLGGAVAKISHDLRNILTTAQLFTDRIEASEDPAVQRMAPKLVGSISRAVNLCESTLAFGRAEEAQPQLSRFALAPLVEELVEAERLAAPARIGIEADVPATLMLRADAEQIYRVIGNLVRNARQALEARPAPGQIAISASETEEAWHIRVADNGPGLPEKAKAHLFEPFQGGTRKGGSGLGLAIAAELIRGHGGEIALQDGQIQGAAFEIEIPK